MIVDDYLRCYLACHDSMLIRAIVAGERAHASKDNSARLIRARAEAAACARASAGDNQDDLAASMRAVRLAEDGQLRWDDVSGRFVGTALGANVRL